MKKSELNGFRKALEDMRSDLTSASGKRETLAINMSPEELDRMQDASNRDWAMRGLERDSKRLREVSNALGRIDTGTYGVCDGCEEDIGVKRLAAVPWASSCIVCQEAKDCETALVMAA
jgi:DnaK suppressor protein